MKAEKSEPRTVVISVGGSIIVPKDVDVKFLAEFRKVIIDFINKGNRVVIVAGGGSVCRVYNKAATEILKKTKEEADEMDLDWLGIAATKLNAELLRVLFSDYAYEKVINDPTERIITGKKIVVGSGWEPGCSSDRDAVLLAINACADTVINMSNIDYVYDKDPNKFKNAKPIKKITWNDFLELTGDEWKPGMHVPFDPEASKLCRVNDIKVEILDGRKLKNFENALNGKKFDGTLIG